MEIEKEQKEIILTIDELKSIKAVIKHKLCENDECLDTAIIRLVFENRYVH
jgi:hypothetical protein